MSSSAAEDIDAMIHSEDLIQQEQAQVRLWTRFVCFKVVSHRACCVQEADDLDAMIDEEVACLLQPTSTDATHNLPSAASTPCAPDASDASPEQPQATDAGENPFPTRKAEKAGIMAAFLKAADELAKSHLIKALRGSKWRFRLFDVLEAETTHVRPLIVRLHDACNREHEGVNSLLQSADQVEFRAVPEQGLDTPEDAGRAVIISFCKLWVRRIEAMREEMFAISVQRCVRCWRARKRLAARKKEHFVLYDAFGRCGLESVAARLCRDLGIQRLQDASAITSDQLEPLQLAPQMRHRWRQFQSVYAPPVMSGVFSRTQSAQGFARTTSMREYNRTQSSGSADSEGLIPQRAHSLESGQAGPTSGGGGAEVVVPQRSLKAGSLICEHNRRRSVCKDCFASAAQRAGIPAFSSIDRASGGIISR